MLKQHKDILAAVIRDLRHELLGYTAKDGTAVRGDLDRELERLGVLPDGRVQPIDALPSATDQERQAHYAAEQFIETAKRQGKLAGEARKDYLEQAGYSWINRLVALRALEARRLINGTLAPSADYGGASEALYVLAQTDPARVAAPDGGWWAVLESACTAQANALPGLFGAGDPVLTLRPSIPALRRCVERIGKGPAAAGVAETDKAFADPDAIGWAYQFYQEEAKAAAFASFKAGKKADARATIAAATQLFTEPYMVKWLLQNSLGRSYHEIYPQSVLPAQWEYYIRADDRRPTTDDQTNDAEMSSIGGQWSVVGGLEGLTVMDPCVGSGHFLREAFDMLAAMYREQHADWEAQHIVETILRRHLHGVDIDPRAVQLAALTLYMRALELLRDEARARRRPMPRWVPQQINLATTPSGLDAAMLERHLVRHPEDRPLRPVLERIFEALSQADILGSLLRPGAEIDAAVAKVQAPRTRDMFAANDDAGAIAQHDPTELKRLVLDRIATAFRAEAGSADPADALFGREAERGVRLLQLLDSKYAVVVTNPPYMGSGNMSAPLRKYVEQNYKSGKRDLYAAFILRCLNLCLKGGRVAMVTQQSWMFLSSFADLRAMPKERHAEALKKREFTGLLRETRIESLAHLGPNAFEEIGGEVVQAALFVIQNKVPSSDQKIIAMRLVGFASAVEKSRALSRPKEFSIIRNTPRQDSFVGIPDAPISYWLTGEFLERFVSNSNFASTFVIKGGLSTTDNERFVRYVWDSPTSDRWISYTKGGGYGRWVGFNYFNVEWGYYGIRMKEYIVTIPGNSHWSRRIFNSEYYFLPGYTYSPIASGSLSLRRMSGSSILGHKGPGVFPASNVKQDVAGIYNTRIMTYMLRAIAPQLGFEVNHLLSLPRYEWDENIDISIASLSSFCSICKSMLVSTSDVIDCLYLPRKELPDATGMVKKVQAYLSTCEGCLEQFTFTAYKLSKSTITSVLADTSIPAGFHPLIAGYDALPELPLELELPELPREVIKYLEQHERRSPSPTELARIKARLRALYEAGPGAKDDGTDEASDAEGGEDDEGEGAVAGAHIPIPTETFLEELSVKMELHPISVYWLLEELRAEGARCKPEERRLLEDRLSVLALRLLGHRWPRQIEAGEPLPAWADADGIIPLVSLGTGEATLAERLRERLREEDGQVGAQRTEALLQELTGATGLEDWLARIFWPRHVRQFKSRPIAWQLASRPAGAGKGRSTRQAPLFECMLYYHATSGDALARLRTQYVEPLLRREESALNEALGKENTASAASANGRVQ